MEFRILKRQPQSELHDARRRRGKNLADRGGTHISYGVGEIGVVKDVKELPADLQANSLPNRNHLEERGVEIVARRPGQGITSAVAESSQRRRGKGGGIEVARYQLRPR